MGLTAEIAEFVAGLTPRQLPDAAFATVRGGFADCIAVMLAGWQEPAARIVRATLPVSSREGKASPLQTLAGPAPDLALAYGVAAHALDYDDTALAGHPSAVLVPAILAEARATGADGPRMMAAYVAGYEVWAELVVRDRDPHHQKGWHPSAVFGPLAAAAASSVLRRLDRDRAYHAIGIAASMAGGVVGNFGSMTKPFQVGRAAQAGLEATRLAEAGLTAAPDAIEHEAGFLAAISPRGRVDRVAPSRLGDEWRILRHGLNLKLYPVCYAMHRSLNAMEELVSEHGFAAGDVSAINVELGDTQAGILRNHQPLTPLEAKFSVEFGLAAIAVTGRLGMAQLSDDFIARSDVRNVIGRVAVTPIADKDEEEPQHSPYERVSVTLHGGAILASKPVSHPLGHFRRPVPAARLWQKFEECAAPTLGVQAARSLFDRLCHLEDAKSVTDFIESPAHVG